MAELYIVFKYLFVIINLTNEDGGNFMEKIKIGMIGFGKWVKSAYLPALEYDSRAEVVAITASSEETKKKAQHMLGESVIIYHDYQSLLDNADIDAVMMAVPDKVHQEILLACLQKKVPVFYEPPISLVRHQMPIMIDQLINAQCLSFAHLELGYHPIFQRIKSLIDKGIIGALQDVTITLHANWGADPDADLCLIDRMSCWYVDVLNRIIGTVPERVFLLEGNGESGRMQAQGIGIYDYNGVWGIFKADVGRKGKESIVVELTGEKGCIRADYFTGELTYVSGTKANHEDFVESCLPLEPYADYPAVRETVSVFLDNVTGQEPSLGNAYRVAQLSAIGLAIDESKDTGNWVKVKYHNI